MSDEPDTPLPKDFRDPWLRIPGLIKAEERLLTDVLKQRGYAEAAILLRAAFGIHPWYYPHLIDEFKDILESITKCEQDLTGYTEALKRTTATARKTNLKKHINDEKELLKQAEDRLQTNARGYLQVAGHHNTRAYMFYQTPEVQLLRERLLAAVHPVDLIEPLGVLRTFCQYAPPRANYQGLRRPVRGRTVALDRHAPQMPPTLTYAPQPGESRVCGPDHNWHLYNFIEGRAQLLQNPHATGRPPPS
jgi:hypothetical protein